MNIDDMIERSIPLLLGMLFIAAILMFVWALGPWPCEARWDGYDVDWTFQGGCKVLTDSGYIPEDNFRVTTTP